MNFIEYCEERGYDPGMDMTRETRIELAEDFAEHRVEELKCKRSWRMVGELEQQNKELRDRVAELENHIDWLEGNHKAVSPNKCLCERIAEGENVSGFCERHNTDWT